MGKIVVFDSGFGSLSIIRAIQKQTKAHIVYVADQKNFPYGEKTKKELEKIIQTTIISLQKRFDPDLIVVGSNTPSILLEDLIKNGKGLIGVYPPLGRAYAITKTNSVALLVTHVVANSRSFDYFINKNSIAKKIKTIKIDSSELVDLVESGKFLHSEKFCIAKINRVLRNKLTGNNVDVVTLSSTHLPFLLPILKKLFPDIIFLDPADDVAVKIITHKSFVPTRRNRLDVFSTGNAAVFQKNLQKIGLRKLVIPIEL